MKQTISYNIHNILRFRISRDKKRDFMKDTNLPFSFFEVDKVDNPPDITLNIGSFKPSNENCYDLDHKFQIRENYFYCKDLAGTARWEVEIFGFEEGNTVINFYCKHFGPERILFPDLLPQYMILKPLIEYKLSRQGYFTIHSAAVGKEDQAYLLSGRPGAFKTTIALNLIRNAGFAYLCDDRTIIHEDEVLSFPMHLFAFEFMSKYLPTEDLQGVLGRIRLVRYLKGKNDYRDCTVSVIKSSKLNSLFFISRTNKHEVKKTNLDLDEAVSRLVINNQAEMMKGYRFMLLDFGYYFYKYILAYSFIFPNSHVARYWDDLEKGLRELLYTIPVYEIEIPYKFNSKVFDEVCKVIK